jgi:amino acid transporter
LISFFVGAGMRASGETLRANLAPAYRPGTSLFTMFALFFPAATGIMAGANMSGDLKDPGRAIPSGTLWSIAVTGVVYLAMAVALGAATDRSMLTGSNMVVRDIAWVPLLITLGVFAATLSSGLGSMMGAPRILQALARDQVFRRLRFFSRGSGAADEPRRAIFLTFLIAQAGVMLGDLNAIAPIITMFFMITYGYLNLATFYEAITRNPSYRPTFKASHWSTALLGAIGCATVMVLVSPLWAVTSMFAMMGLHATIRRRHVITNWGDVQAGVTFERARKNLLRMEREEYHPKNWRPSILALSGAAWTRPRLAVFGHWLARGRGVLTLAQVIAGDTGIHLERRAKQEDVLRRFIRELRLDAFPAVLVAPSLALGIEGLVQCYGIGALRPNVALLGWSSDPEKRETFTKTLRTVTELKRSVIIIRPDATDGEDPWRVPDGTIDVWWRGKANGNLMLLLAHLLAENRVWRARRIRLLRTIPSEAGRTEATRHLEELVRNARIEATATVFVSDDFLATLRERSQHAAVVFLGFQPPEEGESGAFLERIDSMMAGLGTAIIVWSSGDASLEV